MHRKLVLTTFLCFAVVVATADENQVLIKVFNDPICADEELRYPFAHGECVNMENTSWNIFCDDPGFSNSTWTWRVWHVQNCNRRSTPDFYYGADGCVGNVSGTDLHFIIDCGPADAGAISTPEWIWIALTLAVLFL